MIPPGGYVNVRDAEEAFIWLLKKTKVDETWSWDKVMRTIIMEPLYKALNTSAEKKNTFQKVSGSHRSKLA
jgi:pre-mRNA-processing factor 40